MQETQETGVFNPWVRKIPWRKWQPTPVFFTGKLYGQKSVADYSPRGRKQLDMTDNSAHSPTVPLAVMFFS